LPYYYQGQRTATTSGTAGTETLTDVVFLTVAQVGFGMTTITVNARSPSGTNLAGTALNLRRYSTASTGAGTALASVGKAHPDIPTKSTGITTGSAVGTTGVLQKTVGCAAPGGAGGWMAIERDDAIQLKANGGANGNMESATIAGIASIVMDYSFDFLETT